MATPSTNLTLENWYESTLSSSISASDTAIPLTTVPTGTEGFLVIEPDSSTNREVIFYNAKTASQVTCPSVAQGRGQDGTSAISHNSGVTVRMTFTKGYWTALQDASAQSGLSTRLSETSFDYIASGCVWSGDSYGSTRVASCTSGVVYLSGKRLTVAAVTSRTFTASKDVYCDLKDNGDGTAVWVYYDNTTNAASPSFATTTGTLRGAIVVVGASSIANAAAINQGQPDRVLPIASSVPYAVVDSLGNLICPRDPSRKVLGYRQITTDATTTDTSTNGVAVTGLSLTISSPTERKIKITVYSWAVSASTSTYVDVFLWDGSIGGTLVQAASNNSTAATNTRPMTLTALVQASGSKTYVVSFKTGAGTATFGAQSTRPGFILVELD